MTYDLRFRFRPLQPVSPDIVIINIDDDTLNRLGQWPLPRDYHASLVDVFNELGVQSIVFDILFSESSEYDGLFAESIKKAHNVYLPVVFHLPDFKNIKSLFSHSHKILTDVLPSLKQAVRHTGHINVVVDADGKVRRIPLFLKHDQEMTLQLALQAACDYRGIKSSQVRFEGNLAVVGERLFLPLDEDGGFAVNYPGPWANSFQQFSYLEILKAYQDRQEGKIPSLDLTLLKGKVCLIGLTAAGTTDLRATPLENIYPMLGLQASVLNSIFQQSFIRDAGRGINTVINLIICLISLALCWRLTPLKALAASLTLAGFYFIGAIALFSYRGIWVDLFLPLALVLVTYGGCMLWRFLNEIKRREFLEKELEIAEAIQQNFLPQDIHKIPGFSIAYWLQPAKTVSGDFYDVFPLGEKKVGIVLGDVCGKGVPAALLMAKTISLFRILGRQYPLCHEVFQQANKELYGKSGERFVTALYMIIDREKKKVWVTSAGQGPLFLYSHKEKRVIEPDLLGDVPLALLGTVDYQSASWDIACDDKIIIFTDGVMEARNLKGQEFGLENIKKIISENAGRTNQRTLESLQQAIARFAHNADQHDDMTMLIVSLQENCLGQ